ncbi:hypothetical protein ACHAWU_001741 [Discostella pseudostelligera]|uniref:Ubiquitin fusion degradation protein UFD1 N-terminal subdomain 2 domain-containing protein n=1 Tax=Discostella pseudostelligera TaxID=259834 RepID=A0ABD3M857_9STRA
MTKMRHPMMFNPLVVVLLLLLLQSTAAPTAAAAAASTAAASSSSSSSSPFHYDATTRYPTPNLSYLRREGLLPYLRRKWDRAQYLALLEQAVEDHNAEHVATTSSSSSSSSVVDSLSYRRCLVLPLDAKLFDPPMGVFSHGHVDTGDKMSLPKNFWNAIIASKAEVPWLFEVCRVEGVTSWNNNNYNMLPRAVFDKMMGMGGPYANAAAAATGQKQQQNPLPLSRAIGGAIDFRSPNNYAFLPKWMFTSMGLRPFDVVDIRLVTTTPPGSSVKLRPHNSSFLKITNHQAVLETELKHYSALTRGSIIPFDYRGERHYFDVVDLRCAPRGERVPMVKVQDCDIAAEFVRSRDELKKIMAEKRKKQKQKQTRDE